MTAVGAAKKLAFNSVIMGFAGVVGGFAAYAFQIFMGRMLSPADFVLLSTVIAAVTMLLSPFGAVSMFITRKVSVHLAGSEFSAIEMEFFSWLLRFLIIFLVLSPLLYIYSGFIKSVIKVESRADYVLFILIIASGILFTVSISFVHGLQRFKSQAVIGVMNPVFRIFFGFIFVFLGYKISGALSAIFLSYSLSFVCALFACRNLLPNLKTINLFNKKEVVFSRDDLKGLTQLLFANVAFSVMTQFDMLWVNYFYSDEVAAQFAAGSVLAKAMLYIPGGIVAAMYPLVAALTKENKSTHLHLMLSLSFALFACLLLIILYLFFGSNIIAGIYGTNYVFSENFLTLYALALLPMALVFVAENYLIAKKSMLFIWVFAIILPFEFVALAIFGHSLYGVILILGLSNLLVAVFGFFIINNRKSLRARF